MLFQVCGLDGDTLLHRCCTESKDYEDAGLFLAAQGADLNRTNSLGETPLHLAAKHGLKRLSVELLNRGANPNTQTIMGQEVNAGIYRQTALHLAIMGKHVEVIAAIIRRFGDLEHGDPLRPNLDLKNSEDLTPLSLALSNGLHDIGMELIKGEPN